MLPDVSAWPGLEVLDTLPGGHRSAVHLARRGADDYVVRSSSRSPASLDWELAAMAAARDAGMQVPATAPTGDGRLRDDRVWVQAFAAGGHPTSTADWIAVRAAVGRLHAATGGWSQRPGSASAAELPAVRRGGDIDLDALPPGVEDLLVRSWSPILTNETCLVHGDLQAANVVMTAHGPAIIDWDEARVDVAAFDLSALPTDVGIAGDRQAIRIAGVAWEVATCWRAEPAYAARRLAELRAADRGRGQTS